MGGGLVFLDEQTKQHLLWADVLRGFHPRTPMGRAAWKRLAPFLPGQEREWAEVLAEQERLRREAERDPDWGRGIAACLSRVPDVLPLFPLLRGKQSPGITGWFQLKGFLWQVKALGERLAEKGLQALLPGVERDLCRTLLRRLNPDSPLTPSFSLAPAFDERLGILRGQLERLDREIQEEREALVREIAEAYGVRPNRWGEWVVDRRSDASRRMAEDRRLLLVRESAFDRVFAPAPSPEGERRKEERAELEARIEAVEGEVMQRLAAEFAPHVPALERAAEAVARFDLQWSRMEAARRWGGCRPRLSKGSIRVSGGVHPAVAERLRKEGCRFTPVDIRVDKGATVIVGPNMGGKTMALRTLGLIVALAQHGFFVPAARCEMPLVSFVSGVMGDGQDAREGLSTFGAEVKRVAEWFGKKGGLLLIDEIGRGTNPVEGAALSAAVTARLARSDHWAVHVTHYGEVLEVAGIRRYRTAGLREAGGNREDWTGDDWSSRMDFRLIPLAEGEGVPRQALGIAEAMGMPREIVEDARRRIAGESGNAEGSSDGRKRAERPKAPEKG